MRSGRLIPFLNSNVSGRAWLESMAVAILVFLAIVQFDLYTMFYHELEVWELDEIVIALLAGVFTLAIRKTIIVRKAYHERDRALKAFKGSKELYRHIVENAHEMIFDVDMKGRVSFANKATERFMEYPVSELLGRQYLDFIPDDQKSSIHRHFVVQAARKVPVTYLEGCARSKSGRIIWFGQNVRLKMEEDLVVGFQVISRDITERKLAEEQLRKSEETLRVMLDHSPLGVALIDPSGKVLEANPVFSDMFGYSKAELRQRVFSEMTVPEDVVRAGGLFHDLLEGRRTQYQIEKRFVRKDGTVFWGRQSVSALKAPHSTAAAVVMAENIDQWKQAEESNRRLQSIMKETSDLVALADPQGHFVYVNSSGRKLLGIADEESVEGLSPREFYDDQTVAELKSVIGPVVGQTGRWQGDLVLHSRSGAKATVSQVILAHKDKEGRLLYFSTIARDVTELRRAQAEKEDSIRKLKAALAEVRTLSGLLPICSGCKKIRDDSGYWNKIESYLETHTGAQFSHGLCPDCVKTYFPGFEPDSGSKEQERAESGTER